MTHMPPWSSPLRPSQLPDASAAGSRSAAGWRLRAGSLAERYFPSESSNFVSHLHPGRLTAGTWEYGPPSKGESSSKPSFSGSMLILGGVILSNFVSRMLLNQILYKQVTPGPGGGFKPSQKMWVNWVNCVFTLMRWSSLTRLCALEVGWLL